MVAFLTMKATTLWNRGEQGISVEKSIINNLNENQNARFRVKPAALVWFLPLYNKQTTTDNLQTPCEFNAFGIKQMQRFCTRSVFSVPCRMPHRIQGSPTFAHARLNWTYDCRKFPDGSVILNPRHWPGQLPPFKFCSSAPVGASAGCLESPRAVPTNPSQLNMSFSLSHQIPTLQLEVIYQLGASL